MIKKLNFD